MIYIILISASSVHLKFQQKKKAERNQQSTYHQEKKRTRTFI